MQIKDVKLSDSSFFSNIAGVDSFYLVILNNPCSYTVVTASPVSDVQVTSLVPSDLYGGYTDFTVFL